MSANEAFNECRQIEFRSLMTRLADLVGRHQLPINSDAVDINGILDGDPVHYDLIREVVRAIYRSNRCSHLDARVEAETVFNCLGDIRGRLLADRDTDVDQVNLLEELGYASRVVFGAPPPDAENQSEHDKDKDDPPVVLQYPA